MDSFTYPLSDESQHNLAYTYGIDTLAKKRMAEAFAASPETRPFSRFVSIPFGQGAFATTYKHLMYPGKVIRIQNMLSGDAQVPRAVKMSPSGHSHYMENWVLTHQGYPHTPKVDMYLRHKNGATLAMMEALLPPNLTAEDFLILTGLKEKRTTISKGLTEEQQQLSQFLHLSCPPFRLDIADDNIMRRKNDTHVVTDPLY